MFVSIFTILVEYWPALLSGLATTLLISLCAIALGSVLSLVLVAGESVRHPVLSLSIRTITQTIISLPVLVLIIWIFYCLPQIGISLSPVVSAIVALGVSLAAFLAELVRGGIKAVPPGQLEVARLLGVPNYFIYVKIVLPQVARVIAPAYTSECVATLKFSVIASIIAVPEILYQGSLITAVTYRPLEVYSIIALSFILLILPFLWLSRHFEKHSSWTA